MTISAKEIAEMAEENARLAVELTDLGERWQVVQREIIDELGEGADTSFISNRAYLLAQKRHPELYARQVEVEHEIARRRAIIDTVVAAGWASQYEMAQMFSFRKETA